jgi:hypothetical protein
MISTVWIWFIVNWISLPLLGTLGGILVRRKLHREFPFFFVYIVVTLASGAIRMATQSCVPMTYFYAYWITDLVMAIFSTLAVYELFARRLFPGFYKIRVYRYLFAVAAVGIISFAGISAIESPNAAAAFAIEERVLDSIIVGALGFFVALMMFMGRQWTRYDFGIAFGFGIDAASFLIMSAVWVRSHYQRTAIEEFPVIAYDLGCFVWLYCFWSREKKTSRLPETAAPELVRQAQSWEKLLKQWLVPKKKLF